MAEQPAINTSNRNLENETFHVFV